MADPVQPHPITFTVYESDNTTLANVAQVLVINATKKSISAEGTTNTNGNKIIDLANLPVTTGQTVPYEAGDKILIIGYKGNDSVGASYTVVGESKDQTLYLIDNVPYGNKNDEKNVQTIMHLLTGNTTGTVAYCKIFDTQDGSELAHIETPTHDSQSIVFGPDGLKTRGFIIEREAQTLIVHVIIL